jgi:hypothetical protein
MEKFVEEFKRRQSKPEPTEQESYTAASEEERHSILEDWVVTNLEDPEFVQKCADMERLWRRIGFEM